MANKKKPDPAAEPEVKTQDETAGQNQRGQPPQDPQVASLSAEVEAQIAAAEQKVDEAEKKMNELQESLVRTAAEYDNFRKRSQREKDSSYGNGVCDTACQLLPIIDTLEAAANAETTDAEYKKGVMLTLAKCEEVFGRLGIHEIPALGEPFDPELHNAVMQEAVEGYESGIITRVMQKGYRQKDRVVRHAMVAVAP